MALTMAAPQHPSPFRRDTLWEQPRVSNLSVRPRSDEERVALPSIRQAFPELQLRVPPSQESRPGVSLTGSPVGGSVGPQPEYVHSPASASDGSTTKRRRMSLDDSHEASRARRVPRLYVNPDEEAAVAERDHAARLSTSSPSMAPVSASESGWSGSSSTNPFPHSSGGMPGTLRSPALLDDRAPDLRHSLASRSVPPMAQERLAGASRPPDRGYHGSQRAEGARGVHSSPLAGSAREMRDVVPPYRQGRDYQDSPSPYYAAAPSTARPDLLTHRPSPPSLPSLSASPSSHYHFETRSSLSSASSAYGHGGGYYHRDHHRTGHLDHRLEYLHDRDYRQHHDLVRYDGEGAEMGIGHGAGFGVDTRNRKRRGNLPKETTDKLRSWFLEHLHHPYPTEEEKQEMVRETGLLMNQISNWFINARRRQLPSMMNNARNESSGGSGNAEAGENRSTTAGRTGTSPDAGAVASSGTAVRGRLHPSSLETSGTSGYERDATASRSSSIGGASAGDRNPFDEGHDAFSRRRAQT